MNAVSKRRVTADVINEQATFELPDRQLLALVTVLVTNVLNNLNVEVDVRNNNVAVQVCAVVSALNTIIAPASLTCEVQQ